MARTDTAPGAARLSTLLEPLAISDFLSNYYGLAPLFQAGDANRFPPVKDTCDPFVTGLARDLELEVEAPVKAAIVEGGGDESRQQGMSDLFVLQLRGGRQYRVCAQAEGECEEYILQPGSLLYVPRSFWRSWCGGDGSASLEFAVTNPTGAQLLEWVTEKIRHHEAFLADVPRFAGPEEQHAYQTAMRQVIMRVFRMPNLIVRYSRRLNNYAPVKAATETAWPEGAPPEECLIHFGSGRRPRLLRVDSETMVIIIQGRQIPIPPDATPLLHFLIDEAPVTAGRFYACFQGEYEPEELSDFLSALQRTGAITIE